MVLSKGDLMSNLKKLDWLLVVLLLSNITMLTYMLVKPEPQGFHPALEDGTHCIHGTLVAKRADEYFPIMHDRTYVKCKASAEYGYETN